MAGALLSTAAEALPVIIENAGNIAQGAHALYHLGGQVKDFFTGLFRAGGDNDHEDLRSRATTLLAGGETTGQGQSGRLHLDSMEELSNLINNQRKTVRRKNRVLPDTVLLLLERAGAVVNLAEIVTDLPISEKLESGVNNLLFKFLQDGAAMIFEAEKAFQTGKGKRNRPPAGTGPGERYSTAARQLGRSLTELTNEFVKLDNGGDVRSLTTMLEFIDDDRSRNAGGAIQKLERGADLFIDSAIDPRNFLKSLISAQAESIMSFLQSSRDAPPIEIDQMRKLFGMIKAGSKNSSSRLPMILNDRQELNVMPDLLPDDMQLEIELRQQREDMNDTYFKKTGVHIPGDPRRQLIEINEVTDSDDAVVPRSPPPRTGLPPRTGPPPRVTWTVGRNTVSRLRQMFEEKGGNFRNSLNRVIGREPRASPRITDTVINRSDGRGQRARSEPPGLAPIADIDEYELRQRDLDEYEIRQRLTWQDEINKHDYQFSEPPAPRNTEETALAVRDPVPSNTETALVVHPSPSSNQRQQTDGEETALTTPNAQVAHNGPSGSGNWRLTTPNAQDAHNAPSGSGGRDTTPIRNTELAHWRQTPPASGDMADAAETAARRRIIRDVVEAGPEDGEPVLDLHDETNMVGTGRTQRFSLEPKRARFF